MKLEAPPNVLKISGLGSLQGILQSKNIELIKHIQELEDALRDIAEDDCGCCDCAQRAREALGMKEGD